MASNVGKFLEEHKRAAVEAHRSGDTDKAAFHYFTVLRYEPLNTEALHNMTSILAQAGHRMSAMACASKALSVEPKNPYYLHNFGNVLLRMEHYEAAKQALAQAIKLKDDEGGFYHAMGLAWWPDDPKEVERWLIRGFAKDATNTRIGHDLGLCRLMMREWDKGFTGLAAYSMKPHPSMYPAEAPEWRGQDLTGKTLLVYGDQGFGDVIQWSRFYDSILDKAVFAVQPALRRFMQFNGFKTVDLNSPPPDTDYHCLMTRGLQWLDVPGRIARGDLPMLVTERSMRINPSPHGTLLTVGLAWAGNPDYGNDGVRSIGFENYLAIADVPGLRLVSLQYGKHDGDIAVAGARGLVEELHPMVHDIMGMADVVADCDIILSVDTSVLHLAGAMGKDAIGILPYSPCWRWGRPVSAKEFYPTVELVKQPVPNDWTTVMMEVRKRIGERLEKI